MARVTQVNRGGVVVRFGRLRGFVPNSHLTSVPRGLRGDRLRQAKSDLVGQTLSLVLIEVSRKRGNLILSEGVVNRRQRRQLFIELTVGEVRTGIVRNIVDFGAFVDLGGVDGLIHVSELDWRPVLHPSGVLSVGDKVKVYILSVDQERERIGLSRKRLLSDPWPVVTEDLSEGQVVEGTVTRAVDRGVYVDLGDGVEGLLHISGGDEVRMGLEPGSSIRVRVLQVDRQRRRISLAAASCTCNALAESGILVARRPGSRRKPTPGRPDWSEESITTLREGTREKRKSNRASGKSRRWERCSRRFRARSLEWSWRTDTRLSLTCAARCTGTIFASCWETGFGLSSLPMT